VLELQEFERDKMIHPVLGEEAGGGVDVSGGRVKSRAILDPERGEPESGVNVLTTAEEVLNNKVKKSNGIQAVQAPG
jgi:hypothetical protein